MSDVTVDDLHKASVYITAKLGNQYYQASGILIAPDEVLTASHVVYQTGVGTASDIRITPDYASGAAPFGTMTGDSIHYNAINDSGNLISLADSQNDYAVIHMSQSLNLRPIAFGHDFAGGPVLVTGYPQSSSGNQIDIAETVRVDPSYTLLDGVSTGPGSSGGAVWTNQGGVPQIVGVVSSGNGTNGYNALITSKAAQQISSWMAQDHAGSAAVPENVSSLSLQAAQITRFYETALGRAPETGAVPAWQQQLNAGLTPQAMAQIMACSFEFQADHNCQSLGSFVASLYQSGLGRLSGAGELQGWVSQMQAGATPAAVTYAVANSAEAITHLLS